MDTEYVLDSAFELGELTALEAVTLNTAPEAYAEIRRMVDSNSDMPNNYLANTARTVYESSSEAKRAMLSLMSVPALQDALKHFEERCTYLVQSRLQTDLGVRPPNPFMLAIQGLNPRRYITQESDITEGLVRELLSHEVGEQVLRWTQDVDYLQSALDWVGQHGTSTFYAMLLKGQEAVMQPADLHQTLLKLRAERTRAHARYERERRTLKTQARAAIKKATRLFETLGKDDNLRLFISGKEVELSHPASIFKFVVKPLQERGWLESRTQVGRSHTPYELQLLTKDDVHLARLCVYISETPVLDQLLSLSLFIEAGEEEKLLQKANWFACSHWDESLRERVFSRYPQLAHKVPDFRPRGENEEHEPEARLTIRMPAALSRQEAHWQPFEGRVLQWVRTWMEPVTQSLGQMQAQLTLAGNVAQSLQQLQLASRYPAAAATESVLARARDLVIPLLELEPAL